MLRLRAEGFDPFPETVVIIIIHQISDREKCSLRDCTGMKVNHEIVDMGI